ALKDAQRRGEERQHEKRFENRQQTAETVHPARFYEVCGLRFAGGTANCKPLAVSFCGPCPSVSSLVMRSPRSAMDSANPSMAFCTSAFLLLPAEAVSRTPRTK